MDSCSTLKKIFLKELHNTVAFVNLLSATQGLNGALRGDMGIPWGNYAEEKEIVFLVRKTWNQIVYLLGAHDKVL